MTPRKTIAAASVLGVVGAAFPIVRPQAGSELADVVREVERIDAMRSSLAQTFVTAREVDRETFQQVCRPVGSEARRVAAANGWTFTQLSTKYRNPSHEPDVEALRILHLLEQHEDLRGLWIATSRQAQPGMRYFRRITVERACVSCHGAADARPPFVKEGYPEDRAYGFSVGDLRGVYSVFIPRAADQQ